MTTRSFMGLHVEVTLYEDDGWLRLNGTTWVMRMETACHDGDIVIPPEDLAVVTITAPGWAPGKLTIQLKETQWQNGRRIHLLYTREQQEAFEFLHASLKHWIALCAAEAQVRAERKNWPRRQLTLPDGWRMEYMRKPDGQVVFRFLDQFDPSDSAAGLRPKLELTKAQQRRAVAGNFDVAQKCLIVRKVYGLHGCPLLSSRARRQGSNITPQSDDVGAGSTNLGAPIEQSGLGEPRRRRARRRSQGSRSIADRAVPSVTDASP